VALLLLLALGLAIRSVFRALASDETKIRWRIEEMVEGFNARHLAPVMAGFAPDYRDAATGLTRDRLKDILVYLYFQEVDAKSGRFFLRAELVPDELELRMPESPPGTASLSLHLRFFESRTGTEHPFWDAHVEGELEKREDGWQWVRTTRVNHADRHLFSRP
jgi:hypothetical protein